ncbi:MAG: hypothetical protein JEZ04_07890 [Spirochaetales bacterium]|nr:hypothetical protein [Spirochaetales bacterium]
MTDFDQLFKEIKIEPMRIAVAAAEEVETLSAIMDASEAGIVTPILFGNSEKIRSLSLSINWDMADCVVIDTESPADSAVEAVACVKNGFADFLMKGLVETSVFLKAIINKERGLPITNLLSHIAIFDIPNYPKLLFTTDGGMVMYPDLNQKKLLIENALILTRALGYKQTIVGCLAAKEKVDPKMPATVEAHELKKIGERGGFGADVYVEGPMAMDLVLSRDATKTKDYNSIAEGAVDILLFPNIDTGNAVGKTLMQIPGTRMIGTVMGASVPIVLTSRADSRLEKLNSIRMAGIIAARIKRVGIK